MAIVIVADLFLIGNARIGTSVIVIILGAIGDDATSVAAIAIATSSAGAGSSAGRCV